MELESFLEQLREPSCFFSEAFRVLRPGGLLLSLVPDWEANYKTYFDDITHRTPFTSVALGDLYRMCDFERHGVSIPAIACRLALSHRSSRFAQDEVLSMVAGSDAGRKRIQTGRLTREFICR
jgi:SAM-dependent methyltransferase